MPPPAPRPAKCQGVNSSKIKYSYETGAEVNPKGRLSPRPQKASTNWDYMPATHLRWPGPQGTSRAQPQEALQRSTQPEGLGPTPSPEPESKG